MPEITYREFKSIVAKMIYIYPYLWLYNDTKFRHHHIIGDADKSGYNVVARYTVCGVYRVQYSEFY